MYVLLALTALQAQHLLLGLNAQKVVIINLLNAPMLETVFRVIQDPSVDHQLVKVLLVHHAQQDSSASWEHLGHILFQGAL